MTEQRVEIPGWRCVAPGLYSAGQPAPSRWQSIRDAGVRTVLNLRPDEEQPGVDEARLVAGVGLAYRQLPVANAAVIDPDRIAEFTALVDVHAPACLLVHCGSGNRVGALIALRAHAQGASTAEALQIGRHAGLTSLEPRVRALMAARAS